MAVFSRQRRIRLFLAIFLLLSAALGCGAWYFFHYTKTPEYAIQKIQDSFEKHDWQMFQKYVDMDALLDSSSETLIQALIDTDRPMSGDAKAAMSGFVQMFKAPLALTLRGEVQRYVENGEWTETSADAADAKEPLNLDAVLTRLGLKAIHFRKIDYVAADKAAGTARAGVRIYQADAGEEFVFEMKLTQGADKVWRVTEIQNLHEFIAMIAKAHDAVLESYIEKSRAIMEGHGKNVQEIEQEVSSTLQRGSLGSEETRKALKTIMLDKMAADWMARKEELSALAVPPMAETLHRLRLRICDLRIAYALGYAAWMDDKKATTIRDAETKLKQATTLEHEAAAIARHMTGEQASAPPLPRTSQEQSEEAKAGSAEEKK